MKYYDPNAPLLEDLIKDNEVVTSSIALRQEDGMVRAMFFIFKDHNKAAVEQQLLNSFNDAEKAAELINSANSTELGQKLGIEHLAIPGLQDAFETCTMAYLSARYWIEEIGCYTTNAYIYDGNQWLGDGNGGHDNPVEEELDVFVTLT